MSLALAASAHAQTAPLGPAKRDGVWGQSYSDLKPEAGVRFGQLPNGLRYAVKRNATPGGQAALRLRIGAGSLQERDDQQGLAHFLEHMAFKGSTHVPEGEMIHILQRKGLAFGPDTNAATGFDQTVYQLDLPETDADTLDTGLMLLRETASELTLSQSDMDSERGVILSEERLRDSPAYQSQKAELGFLLAGQRLPQRWPIGKVDIIKTAPVSLIRRYYEANYRPDDATVIAVGDFDPDEMVRKITARFGDWKAKAADPAPADLGQVETRGEAAEVFAKPGAPQEVQLTYAAPYDDTADTFAREQRDTVEQLALAVLNRRLDRISRQPDAPFIQAQASRTNVVKSAKLMAVSVDTTPDGWARGLAAAAQEVRRAGQFGVTAPELAREIAEMRTQLASKAAGAATRKTPAVADEIVEVVGEDEVLTGPVQNAALFERYVKAATLPAVDAALKGAFQGSGPLLTLSSSQPVPGGEAALRQAYDAAAAKPVTADVTAASKPWPYGGQAFGAPGKVVDQHAVADLGLVQARFANGVTLTVKRTPFATDEVYVAVSLGDGRLGLPRDHASPLWAAAALTAGGTRELTADQIEQTLADKVVSARFQGADDAWRFTAKTRPADLVVQLQLLAAYTSRPGFRSEAFDRYKAGLSAALPQIESTPSGVLARDLPRLLHGGDARFQTLPTAAELAPVTAAALPAMVGAALASGPVEIAIVGDVDPQAAIAAVASTYGALPQRRPYAPPAAARDTAFPAPDAAPVVETHAGRADQAIAFAAWPLPGFYADPRAARTLDVTAQVLETRLVEKVRMAEGATYSPNAGSTQSQVFPHYGDLQALVETPPAKIAGFWRDLGAIAADMRARPPSADELARAKKPLVETLMKQRQSNEFWLLRLARAWGDPRALDAIRSQLPDLQKVSAADVQAAARARLNDAKMWRLVVRSPTPAPGAPEEVPIPVKPPTTPAPATTPGSPIRAPTPGTKTGAPSPAPSTATPAAPGSAAPRS